MFKSLKLYSGLDIDLDRLLLNLVDFGYKRQESVSQEGDFSRRGGVIDIFPNSFELPVRIELEDDSIVSIKSFNPNTAELLWEHRIVIILKYNKHSSFKTNPFTEEFPLSNFIDIKLGDYVVHNQHGVGRFLGLNKIVVKDKLQVRLVIEYDRQEKLCPG